MGGGVAMQVAIRHPAKVIWLGQRSRRDVSSDGFRDAQRPRSESSLAILPDTTHITLMDRLDIIVPMVNDFLDARRQKRVSGPNR